MDKALLIPSSLISGGVLATAAHGVRFVLGFLFVAASIAKLRRPYDFLDAVYQYSLVGPRAGAVVAAVLPALELVIGVCLLMNAWPVPSLVTASGLGAAFAAAQGIVLVRGISTSCGCFGLSEPVGPATLARACALCAAASFATIVTARQRARKGTAHLRARDS